MYLIKSVHVIAKYKKLYNNINKYKNTSFKLLAVEAYILCFWNESRTGEPASCFVYIDHNNKSYAIWISIET